MSWSYNSTQNYLAVNDMLSINRGQLVAIGVVLVIFSAISNAQQTVYKWVDEEGVVHFSDAPPDESESVETETLTTAAPPPNVPVTQPIVKSSAISETDVENQSAQPEIQASPVGEETDITEMSLADLDRRCEDEREKRIAPLREAEIAKCKQQKGRDPAYCERTLADYGEGHPAGPGGYVPRMFHDLPECVEALQERRRRAMRTPADNPAN